MPLCLFMFSFLGVFSMCDVLIKRQCSDNVLDLFTVQRSYWLHNMLFLPPSSYGLSVSPPVHAPKLLPTPRLCTRVPRATSRTITSVRGSTLSKKETRLCFSASWKGTRDHRWVASELHLLHVFKFFILCIYLFIFHTRSAFLGSLQMWSKNWANGHW